MAKNMFKNILNKELSEENQRLLNDLNSLKKRNEILENYRKVLNQFNKNCVCDQNKITAYLFRSLERQYRQISAKSYDQKRQLSVGKSGKSIANLSKKYSPKINKNIGKSPEVITTEEPIGDNNSEDKEEVLVFNKLMNCIFKKSVDKIDKINENVIKKLIIKTPEEFVNKSKEVLSENPNETIVEITSHKNKSFEAQPQISQAISTPLSQSPSLFESIESSFDPMVTNEDDFDILPSFQNPIFSLSANYVEELAAQVVPKIDVQVKTNPKPEAQISGQTFIRPPKTRRSDSLNLLSIKSNLKLNNLLENLKNGRLESFNDPNNDMISIFLKTISPIGDKRVTKIFFKCNYSLCGFETQSHSYIRRHVDRHKTYKDFRIARIKYRAFTNLLEELRNGSIESFIDPNYDLVLVTLRNEVSNEGQSVSKFVYKCLHTNCQFESNKRFYIRNHVMRHKKVTTFECLNCEERFDSKVSLVEHQIKAHDNHKSNLYVCDFPNCCYKTTVRQSLKCHQIKHKSEKTIKCQKIGCDLYFKNINQMKNHMKRVHVLKTVVCEWPGCETKFKSKYELKEHLLAHTGQKITVAKIRSILKEGNYVSTVDKTNKLFSVIRQQIINESNGKIEIGSKLGYKCNYSDCKFICITPYLISEHTLSHSLGKIFECDLCHKTYGLRYHLNNHKKLVHNINNKYPLLICAFSECNYNTRNPYCLRQHQRTHQKETPFKCTQIGCEKMYKTMKSLKQHIRNSHTTVHLLACDWPGCKSSFKSNTYLKYHTKCHLNPKETFSCEHCSKSFNFKANLTKHMKSQHILN